MLEPQQINSAMHARRVRVDATQWLEAAQQVRAVGGGLIAVWGSDERDRGAGFVVRGALREAQSVLVLELAVPEQTSEFPSLTPIFASADRMQRAIYDLLGARATAGHAFAVDRRPWLRHASWPDAFPLRRDFGGATQVPAQQEHYPFVAVDGNGVHEIPVGPVHAGIIEPGHFRFSVVGEKVLRLEERLGYVHKGTEKRFEQLSLVEGQRLAARVSGDSAAAFSWAYCMALEGICGATPPVRALALRALALERERIANHLGDLGALGNDAGFGVGLAQFSRLKEDVLRLNALSLGSRYPMDEIVPGGVAHDLTDDLRRAHIAQLTALEREVVRLRGIYDEHAGIQDRFIGAGTVEPALAEQLGLTGLAGRASGQARDLRCDNPCAPYERLGVKKMVRHEGDVAARVALRFDELLESAHLCRELLHELPAGAVREVLPIAADGAFGLGLVEGWRGPVLVALEAGPAGAIRRCHPHDPSWHNWPLLEHAVIGNIVPDFPLINKSFNLSYSGHDL